MRKPTTTPTPAVNTAVKGGVSMNTEKMILGEGTKAVFSTDPNTTGLNNNVIVCAGSGCGKTMSIIEPRLMELHDTSVVVSVTKRRIVDKYKKMFKEKGYQVFDMNFTGSAGCDTGYDPLKFITTYEDITHLAQSIVYANPNKMKGDDPYWHEASVNLMAALIGITMIQKKKKATFADVYDTVTNLSFTPGDKIETSLDDIFEKVIASTPTHYVVSRWLSFKNLAPKTAGCVLGMTQSSFSTMFSVEVINRMRKLKTVDVKDIAIRKTALFITSSPVNKAQNMYVNMFYAHLFKSLFEYAESLPSGKLPIPVTVLADDFATGAPIADFPEYISIFREKQISVMLLLQSETQLARMYSEYDATTIINNCDTYVYMGSMDIKTAQDVSARLNCPLEDVLNMPVGREVIFRRGQKPLITDRYNICADPTYQKITADYEQSISEEPFDLPF